jgi:hypothetical protein
VFWGVRPLGVWTRDNIWAELKNTADAQEIKVKDFLAPLFVAISGSAASFSVVDSMELLGPDMSRARIRHAIEVLGGVSKKAMKRLEKEYQQLPVNYDVTEIKDPIPEPSLLNNIDSTTDTLGYLKDNILEELKLPTVVLILFIILSSSRIDSLFVKTHSNFFVDSVGSLTFPSLFIKGIIAALIFYIFKLFL